jgi:Acetyltransferase (GNAT) domain
MLEVSVPLIQDACSKDQRWFATAEFCHLYLDPPADRTYCPGDESAGWKYRVIGRKLIRTTVFTPAPPAQRQMEEFVHSTGCHIASFELVPQAWLERLGAANDRIRITSAGCDYVVSLPETVDAYVASLGTKTRRQLRRADRLAKRELGSRLTCEYLSSTGIDEGAIRSLVRLNALRLRAKRQRIPWTQQAIAQHARLARQCGMLCRFKVDDSVVAGSLSFCHGDEAFLGFIAHHPKYDKFRLGVICLLRTVERLIQRRFRSYHLLWGDGPQRERFGGRPVQLQRVLYFRNWYYAKAWDLARATHTPLVLRICRTAKEQLYMAMTSYREPI